MRNCISSNLTRKPPRLANNLDSPGALRLPDKLHTVPSTWMQRSARHMCISMSLIGKRKIRKRYVQKYLRREAETEGKRGIIHRSKDPHANLVDFLADTSNICQSSLDAQQPFAGDLYPHQASEYIRPRLADCNREHQRT